MFTSLRTKLAPMRAWMTIGAVAVALGAAGCGGGGGGGTSNSPTSPALLPTGNVLTPAQGVTISAAAGAVQTDVYIGATPVTTANLPTGPSGIQAVAGSAYALTFSAYSGTIASNVTLTLPYTSLPIGETTAVAFRIYAYSPTSHTWTPLAQNTVADPTATAGSVSAAIATTGETGAFATGTTYAVFDDSPTLVQVPLAIK